MKTRIILAFALIAAVGCADLNQPGPPNHPIKATTGGAFESQTLYSCTGSTGSVISFSASKSLTSVLVRTGVIWVKPHSGLDATPTAPTTPIPSANAIANGWVRLGDNQSVNWGIESNSGTGDILGIKNLEVWCETQGDLVVVAH